MTHRRGPLWKREKAKADLPQDAPGRRAGDVLPAAAEARVNRPRAASELPAGPGERRRRRLGSSLARKTAFQLRGAENSFCEPTDLRVSKFVTSFLKDYDFSDLRYEEVGS